MFEITSHLFTSTFGQSCLLSFFRWIYWPNDVLHLASDDLTTNQTKSSNNPLLTLLCFPGILTTLKSIGGHTPLVVAMEWRRELVAKVFPPPILCSNTMLLNCSYIFCVYCFISGDSALFKAETRGHSHRIGRAAKQAKQQARLQPDYCTSQPGYCIFESWFRHGKSIPLSTNNLFPRKN